MTLNHALTAIFVALIWGVGFSIVEIGLSDFPPIFNVAIRFITVVFPLVFFVKRPNVGFHYVCFLGISYTCTFSLIYLGIYSGVPSGLSSLILQSTVLFSVLLSCFFFKEVFSLTQFIALLVGSIGILLIAIDGDYKASFIGFLIVVLASFFNALCTVIIKKSGGSLELFPLMVWSSIIPPIPLLILSYFYESQQIQSLINIDAVGVFSVYYTSIIATVLAFILWGRLLSIYPVSTVAPFNLLIPFFALFSSSILLGETFSGSVFISFFLISSSLVIIFFESSLNHVFKQIKSFFKYS
ncbi:MULTISPECIES: EamA family transporter [unclassified Pseudoalteromonas]|uniref:EamA family transporter n=1 Tax=unclassified Pseudoalteromonas TaxID=194690 RepID=UPI0013EE5202|nr:MULTISPECIES: EamA family transporter [unclassified Pseudoalteromonas]MCG7540017.1 EamA family transporter [Pseudoalteromonas sp. OF7H-1]